MSTADNPTDHELLAFYALCRQASTDELVTRLLASEARARYYGVKAPSGVVSYTFSTAVKTEPNPLGPVPRCLVEQELGEREEEAWLARSEASTAAAQLAHAGWLVAATDITSLLEEARKILTEETK